MSATLAIRDEQHYLATVAEVRMLAERIERVDEAKELADKAAAARVWAQRQRLGLEKVNLAAAAHLWAKRREGELLSELRASGELRPGNPSRREGLRLRDLGVTERESHEVQKLAAIPSDRFAQILEELVPEGRITQAEVERRSERRDRERAAREREAQLVSELQARGGPSCRLAVADLRDFDPGVELDAIVTDPPYVTQDAIDLYAALGEFAVRTLKPAGALAAMTSQRILPEVLAALRRSELVFHWQVCWLSGAHESTVDFERKVISRWKPVLVYHLGSRPEKARLRQLPDVVDSGRDLEKESHPWQQTLDGMRQLVRALADPGHVVCDPFLGSGTTALAALAENRSFVGCDVNADAVEITRRRLSA
jgi:hypothetical protein